MGAVTIVLVAMQLANQTQMAKETKGNGLLKIQMDDRERRSCWC